MADLVEALKHHSSILTATMTDMINQSQAPILKSMEENTKAIREQTDSLKAIQAQVEKNSSHLNLILSLPIIKAQLPKPQNSSSNIIPHDKVLLNPGQEDPGIMEAQITSNKRSLSNSSDAEENEKMKKVIVSSQAESRRDSSACKASKSGTYVSSGPDGRQANSAPSSAAGAEVQVERDSTASDPSSPARTSSKGGKGSKSKTSDPPEKPKLPRKPALDRSRIPLGSADQKKAAPGQGRYPRL